MSAPRITAALAFTDARGGQAGEKRIRLLQAIGETGSIAAAAKTVGLSYKAAWDAVNTMNNLFPAPLVTAHPGGHRGGGAQLTRDARQVIDAFLLLRGEVSRFVEHLENALQNPSAPALSSMLWSFAMKTSARNSLRGTVKSLTRGAVNAEVILAVADTTDIVAIVTNRGVDNLDLRVGQAAFAMIKASFVILAPADERLATSARNRIEGTIAAIETGAVNDEIILDIGAGKTLTAIITRQSTDSLGFKVGGRACALIKASHVILGVD